MITDALMRCFAVCLAVGAAVGLPVLAAVLLRPVLRRRYSAAGCSALWTGLALLLAVLPPVLTAAGAAVPALTAVQHTAVTAAPENAGTSEIVDELQRGAEEQPLPDASAAAQDTMPSAEEYPHSSVPVSAAPEKSEAVSGAFSAFAQRLVLPAAAAAALRIAAGIWLAGAVLFAAVLAVRQLVWRAQCRRWAQPVPEEAAALYAQLCAQLGVRRAPLLQCTRWVGAPVLTGVLRPVLLLPAAPWQREHLLYIFAHELIHLQRRDLARSLLQCAAGVLHWYHPAVWLLNAAARRDAEQATDAAVLALGGSGCFANDLCAAGRSAVYGEALLHSVRRAAAPLGAGFSVSKKEMKERMKHLFDPRPGRRGVLPVCLLLCLSLAAALFAGCAVGTLQVQTAPEESADTAVRTEADSPESASAQTITLAAQTLTYTGTPPAQLIWPVPEYAMVSRLFEGVDEHSGLDIEAARGADIVAAADGVVIKARYADDGLGYGNYIVLDHGDGVTTLYAHCRELCAAAGDTVSAGQCIARVGSSGKAVSNHCHFEYRHNGIAEDPARIGFPDVLVTEHTSTRWGIPTMQGFSRCSRNTQGDGILFAVKAFSTVCAAAGGVVAEVGSTPQDGEYLVLDHGRGVTSRYTHLTNVAYSSIGAEVEKGWPLAEADASGCIGFAVYRGGSAIDPCTYCWPGMQTMTGLKGKGLWPVPEYESVAREFTGLYQHNGLDIAAQIGADIVAFAGGTVTTAEKASIGYGWHIIIDHGAEVSTLYAHCDELYVKAGDQVKAGQIIAAVGSTGYSTGPHCHFEYRIAGEATDPAAYLETPQPAV